MGFLGIHGNLKSNVKKLKKAVKKASGTALLLGGAGTKISKGKVKLGKKAKQLAGKKLGKKLDAALGYAGAAVGAAGGAAALSGLGAQAADLVPNVSGQGGFGGGWLGGLRQTIGDIQDAVHQGEDLYAQGRSTYDEIFGGSPDQGAGGPSSDMGPGGTGSGSPSIMPYVLIGGGVLVLLLFLRK